MSNDDLDKLLSLTDGTVFPTRRLLDSSVGITLCLPSDLKQPYVSECQLPHSQVLFNALLVWPRRLLSPLPSSFVVSWCLLLEYPRQVPPPTLPFHLHQSTYWLPSTMTDCHVNTAMAPLSACYEAPDKASSSSRLHKVEFTVFSFTWKHFEAFVCKISCSQSTDGWWWCSCGRIAAQALSDSSTLVRPGSSSSLTRSWLWT